MAARDDRTALEHTAADALVVLAGAVVARREASAAYRSAACSRGTDGSMQHSWDPTIEACIDGSVSLLSEIVQNDLNQVPN